MKIHKTNYVFIGNNKNFLHVNLDTSSVLESQKHKIVKVGKEL